MSELDNSLLSEKSEGKTDSSSSLKELNDKWLSKGMIGTSCKCGAHASIPFSEGGQEWLVGHVAEAHAEAFDWIAAIRKALDMPADQGMEFLATLVKHEETKETLGNA